MSGKKRGIKKGQKLKSKGLLSDWYTLCELFTKAKQANPKLSYVKFLQSSASGSSVTGTESEKVIFIRRMKKYRKGKLQPTTKKRQCERKFVQIEEKLIAYVDLREKQYARDKCGVFVVSPGTKM